MFAAVLGIPHLDYIALTAIFFGIGIVEYLVDDRHESKRRSDDFWLELVGTAQFFLYKPLIVFVTGATLSLISPDSKDVLRSMSPWLMLIIVILADDLVQYWYHRAAHTFSFLWKLHRAHHSARQMGFSVTYRNATLFFILMPNLWLSAVLIYLGMGTVYLLYTIVKLTIVMSAHSHLRWDRCLYRYRWLHPIAWIIERTISTPSTHFAHHGVTADDGVSNPNGNFSNMFFFWDILFGTAKITRRYPEEYGVPNERHEPWTVQLYYPLCRSKDPESDLK